MLCDTTDFIYPMCADIYYPLLSQNQYGQVNKQWVFDRTVACSATPVGGAGSEEMDPKVFLQYTNKLIVRTRNDIRTSLRGDLHAVNNILITNIKDSHGNLIYKETAGARSGKGTLYEVGTVEPFTGPFGDIESYKMLWRRTENQSVGD